MKLINSAEVNRKKFSSVMPLSRPPSGRWGYLITFFAVSWSCFQIFTARFGAFEAIIQRNICLMFALALVFLLYPARRGIRTERPEALDYFFSILGIIATLYIPYYFNELMLRAGYVHSSDFFMGLLLISLVLEASRRSMGWVLPLLALFFLAYAFLGPYIPGFWGHRGFSHYRIIAHMFLGTEGIFGIPLGVTTTYVFMFILFSSFLFRTGGGKIFIDLSLALFGSSIGGPAKVAIVSSSMFGAISGSAVANVVGTGTLTIPLMKKVGYEGEYAGAIEAVASTGGQLVPPIMGAAAFIMAEFTGVPYLRIAFAAIIPSFLYYSYLFTSTHINAKQKGLGGLRRDEIPEVKLVLKSGGHLLLAPIALVFLLLKGYTPSYAALYSTLVIVVLSFLKKSTRLSFMGYIETLEQAARDALNVTIASAVVGLIIGTATLTGIGLKIAGGIVALSRGVVLLSLFFTMIASLILGTGLPTTACYVTLSAMVAPVLISQGIPMLASHFFIFYFGIVADLTPPVALASMAGAAIAKSNPIRTGLIASKLALLGFTIPYFFVFNPSLLMVDSCFFEILQNSITAFVGVVCIAYGVECSIRRPFSLLCRLGMVVGGLLLVKPGLLTDAIGLLSILLSFFWLTQQHVWLYKIRKYFRKNKDVKM